MMAEFYDNLLFDDVAEILEEMEERDVMRFGRFEFVPPRSCDIREWQENIKHGGITNNMEIRNVGETATSGTIPTWTVCNLVSHNEFAILRDDPIIRNARDLAKNRGVSLEDLPDDIAQYSDYPTTLHYSMVGVTIETTEPESGHRLSKWLRFPFRASEFNEEAGMLQCWADAVNCDTIHAEEV